MWFSGLAADIVVFFHLLYLFFTVGGEVVILLGGILRWQWVRNRTFRIIHLIAVVLVSFESLIGVLCPLTELEYTLRRTAGQYTGEEISLVGRIIQSILYYDFPGWFFTMLYIGFGVIVILTLFIFPPERKKKV